MVRNRQKQSCVALYLALYVYNLIIFSFFQQTADLTETETVPPFNATNVKESVNDADVAMVTNTITSMEDNELVKEEKEEEGHRQADSPHHHPSNQYSARKCQQIFTIFGNQHTVSIRFFVFLSHTRSIHFIAIYSFFLLD